MWGVRASVREEVAVRAALQVENCFCNCEHVFLSFSTEAAMLSTCCRNSALAPWCGQEPTTNHDPRRHLRHRAQQWGGGMTPSGKVTPGSCYELWLRTPNQSTKYCNRSRGASLERRPSSKPSPSTFDVWGTSRKAPVEQRDMTNGHSKREPFRPRSPKQCNKSRKTPPACQPNAVTEVPSQV